MCSSLRDLVEEYQEALKTRRDPVTGDVTYGARTNPVGVALGRLARVAKEGTRPFLAKDEAEKPAHKSQAEAVAEKYKEGRFNGRSQHRVTAKFYEQEKRLLHLHNRVSTVSAQVATAAAKKALDENSVATSQSTAHLAQVLTVLGQQAANDSRRLDERRQWREAHSPFGRHRLVAAGGPPPPPPPVAVAAPPPPPPAPVDLDVDMMQFDEPPTVELSAAFRARLVHMASRVEGLEQSVLDKLRAVSAANKFPPDFVADLERFTKVGPRTKETLKVMLDKHFGNHGSD